MGQRNKSQLIHVRLTPQQVAKLREMSQQTGMLSMSEVLRSMVDHSSLEPVSRPAARIPVWADNQQDADGNLTPAYAN